MPEHELTNGDSQEQGDSWSAFSTHGLGRSRNSDAWAMRGNVGRLALAVADGVGALPASPAASMAAAHAAAVWLAANAEPQAVGELLREVNEAVSIAVHHDPSSGATTLACVAIEDGHALVISIGDSEVLSISEAGPARLLHDLDHVPSQPLILLGWIDGAEEVRPHIVEIDVLPAILCLVTDGITSTLDYQRIADIARSVPLRDVAQALVEAAQSAGAEDDVTALVYGHDLPGTSR